MKDEMLAHQFVRRLTSARAEVAMLEAEIALLQGRREVLRQYIDQSENLGERLAGERGAIVDAARAVEAHLAQVSRAALESPADRTSEPVKMTKERAAATEPASTPTLAHKVLANDTAKRRRGRPKRVAVAAGPAVVDGGLSEQPVKRGRGRPKRQAVAPAVASADAALAAEPVKRGRGRPRGRTAVQTPAIATTTGGEQLPKRGPGRPKKSTATISTMATPAAASGLQRGKSRKPVGSGPRTTPEVAATAAGGASTEMAPTIGKIRGRKQNQPGAAMLDGQPVLSSRAALDTIGVEGEERRGGKHSKSDKTLMSNDITLASADGAGLEPAPFGDPAPAQGAASVAVDAAPAVPTPISQMEDAILGVLRARNPQLVAIGEIADRARKRLGVARLAATPGHVLESLRKDGLVERVGHKWRVSPNADHLRALFRQ